MLTIEDLKSFSHEFIFACGMVNIPGSDKYEKWVAVRGVIHDWAIYRVVVEKSTNTEWDWDRIARWGDKIHSMERVKELVPCTEEAIKMYRH